jgi:hypothetical protein
MKAVLLRSAAILVIGIAASTAQLLPAHAYDGKAAAAYADTWAMSRNTNYPQFHSDCTNFVSQALHAGGYSYVGYTSNWAKASVNPSWDTSLSHWWVHWYPAQSGAASFFSWSHTWSVAADNYRFQLAHYPGGIGGGTAPGTAVNPYTPSSIKTGDIIYYDWTGDGRIDHANLQVGIGTDPVKKLYGNYVDQHGTDRRHAFWSLQPYNPQFRETKIYFVHISTSNT